VKLRLSRNVSSADSKTGDNVDFEVLEEVYVRDVLVIPKGGVAIGTVTDAEPKRRMARGGKLDMTIDYVRLLDTEKAALRGVKEAKAGGHTGAMTAGIVATSLVVWPAAPFFLFMHGKDITFPKGTEITAYINGDFPLDSHKLHPSAPVEQAATNDSSPVQASLQISSTPQGADIEIDGAFVGETPSTLGVKAGEHDIRISKSGYQSWDRKVRTSSGTVVIDRQLEKGAAQDVTVDSATPVSATQVSSPAVSAAQGPPTQIAHTTVSSEPAPKTQVEGTVHSLIGASSDENPLVRHDGVTLSTVTTGGPADQAGLAAGDIVVAFDNHYVYSVTELSIEIQRHPSGSRVPIRYRRRAMIYDTFITIGNTRLGGG
jgi:hypothetical protein